MASRLALVETLPESVQQLVREGKIAAPMAMRYLVPVARINWQHCPDGRRFRRTAVDHAARPATLQAWRDARGAMRERILTAPKLFRNEQQAAANTHALTTI